MNITKRSTKPELLKYIRETLGLNPSEESTKEELFAIIAENGADVADGDESEAPAAKSGGMSAAELEKTFVKIRLFEKEGDKSSQITMIDPLNLQHITLMRNVEVTVNYPVYIALKNAVTTRITTEGGELVERKIQSEPFEVIEFNAPAPGTQE